MATVFVSYRRDDSEGWVGQVVERVRPGVWPHRIVVDTDFIKSSGEPWPRKIDNALGACKVFILVIGPNWLSVSDENGGRRLDDPKDVHRLEVQKALGRMNVRVIPVCVGGARPPSTEALPDDLSGLADLQAFEIGRAHRFAGDADELARQVRAALPWRPGRFQWAVTVVAAVVLILALVFLDMARLPGLGEVLRSNENRTPEFSGLRRDAGLYLKESGVAGQLLTEKMIETVTGGSGTDKGVGRPRDFRRDLDGMCLDRSVSTDRPLTWEDLTTSCEKPASFEIDGGG